MFINFLFYFLLKISKMKMIHSSTTVIFAVTLAILVQITVAFTTTTCAAGRRNSCVKKLATTSSSSSSSLFSGFDDSFTQETPEDTKERIQELVDNHPVLLFMKGSKLFPQCGFSNTACQILQSFDLDFHTVDILADEAIRQGVKDFSQWPTIPQLYVVCSIISIENRTSFYNTFSTFFFFSL